MTINYLYKTRFVVCGQHRPPVVIYGPHRQSSHFQKLSERVVNLVFIPCSKSNNFLLIRANGFQMYSKQIPVLDGLLI